MLTSLRGLFMFQIAYLDSKETSMSVQTQKTCQGQIYQKG